MSGPLRWIFTDASHVWCNHEAVHLVVLQLQASPHDIDRQIAQRA
jgi:hypothetical protein